MTKLYSDSKIWRLIFRQFNNCSSRLAEITAVWSVIFSNYFPVKIKEPDKLIFR